MFSQSLKVNFFGVVSISKAFLPALKNFKGKPVVFNLAASHDHDENKLLYPPIWIPFHLHVYVYLLLACTGSRLINVSSLAGLQGSPMMGPYVASKHAVEGFAKCLRSELRPWSIYVANINPGIREESPLPSSFYKTTNTHTHTHTVLLLSIYTTPYKCL